MELSQKTLEELKSLAYDQLNLLNLAQDNLRVLNQAIAEKQNEPKDKKDEKK